MGDILSPITVSPPPSSSSPSKSNILMLYYGLIVVGTAAIALALYNYIVIKRCSRGQMHPSQPQRPNGLVEVVVERSMSYENSQRNLLSSFKYKKEQSKKEGGGKDHHNEEDGDEYYYECPVCLSVFEEGEEVRKLPRCKHSYHVQCIDMWLYSHFDCPVCRTPVGPFCRHVPPDNSGGGLPESEGNGGGGARV